MALLFVGYPVLAAVLLAGALYAPFHFLKALKTLTSSFKMYWCFRLALALAGVAWLLIFHRNGGYENLSSSEFSPIGTDMEGLLLHYAVVTVVVTSLVALIELPYVLVERLKS